MFQTESSSTHNDNNSTGVFLQQPILMNFFDTGCQQWVEILSLLSYIFCNIAKIQQCNGMRRSLVGKSVAKFQQDRYSKQIKMVGRKQFYSLVFMGYQIVIPHHVWSLGFLQRSIDVTSRIHNFLSPLSEILFSSISKTGKLFGLLVCLHPLLSTRLSRFLFIILASATSLCRRSVYV